MTFQPLRQVHTPLPTFTQKEMRKVNTLIRDALLSPSVLRRLLCCDEALQEDYRLPETVWNQIKAIKPTSLDDFCDAISVLQRQF